MILTQRVHPFPFRTRKLSFAVAKILAWRRAGKIVHRQHSLKWDIWLLRMSHFSISVPAPKPRITPPRSSPSPATNCHLTLHWNVGGTPNLPPDAHPLSLGGTPNLPPDAHPLSLGAIFAHFIRSYASLAQSVEHLTVNQGVTGSSPVGGAK